MQTVRQEMSIKCSLYRSAYSAIETAVNRVNLRKRELRFPSFTRMTLLLNVNCFREPRPATRYHNDSEVKCVPFVCVSLVFLFSRIKFNIKFVKAVGIVSIKSIHT